MSEPGDPFKIPQGLNEPPGPKTPFVLKNHVTPFQFAQLAQSLNPALARESPEESYVKALAFLQGGAEFIERNAVWNARFSSESAKVARELRTSEEYLRLNDPTDVSRMLDYLNGHGIVFKTLGGFLEAYDKEKLPSYVLSETFLQTRSSQLEQREQSKERIISRVFLNKFIEIRKEKEREQDAKKKREARRRSSDA